MGFFSVKMTLNCHITFLLSTLGFLVLNLPSLMPSNSLIKRILPLTLDEGLFGSPTINVLIWLIS